MDIGSLGKAKAICKLIEDGYDVFMELDGKSPFDLVGHKDGKLFRIEIKSTNTRTKYNTGWEVQIKKVRSNKTKSKITNFNKDQCDLLVIYIHGLNSVFIIPSNEVKTKSILTIYDKDLKWKDGSTVQHQS